MFKLLITTTVYTVNPHTMGASSSVAMQVVELPTLQEAEDVVLRMHQRSSLPSNSAISSARSVDRLYLRSSEQA